MINDKCSGFALITVMFMLVTLITGIFLAAYPLASEPRDDSRQFLSDIKDRKVKYAMFGRMAYQRGGKFRGCEGLYTHTGIDQGGVYGGYMLLPFTKIGWINEGGMPGNFFDGDCKFSPPYSYNSEVGFWAGYRGKCYYYPSPLYASPYVDAFGARIAIKGHCNVAMGVRKYTWGGESKQGCNYMIGGTPGNNMTYIIRDSFVIKIKDYTKASGDRIDLWLISTRNGNAERWTTSIEDWEQEHERVLLEHEYKETIPYNGYSLHIFHKEYDHTGRRGKISWPEGLNKVVITIDNLPVYTTSIVIPFRFGLTTTDKFVEEIEYRETP